MNSIPLVSTTDPIWDILLRMAVELVVLSIIIAGIYNRYSGKKENMFSFYLMGFTIFVICAVLKNVQIQMGIALGLFAIFSIIRFRTSNFSMKDMAYLFTVLGISAINAMLDFPHPVRGTILFNSILIVSILILEIAFRETRKEEETESVKKDKKKKGGKDKKKSKTADIQLIYNKMDLINPEMADELWKDVARITGKKIADIRIRKIDLVNGFAELDVDYQRKSDEDT